MPFPDTEEDLAPYRRMKTPLTTLQVTQARHTLLYLSHTAQGLRTSLGAMFARSDQRQHLITGRAVLMIDVMIADLRQLRAFLTGESGQPGQATERADKEAYRIESIVRLLEAPSPLNAEHARATGPDVSDWLSPEDAVYDDPERP